MGIRDWLHLALFGSVVVSGSVYTGVLFVVLGSHPVSW